MHFYNQLAYTSLADKEELVMIFMLSDLKDQFREDVEDLIKNSQNEELKKSLEDGENIVLVEFNDKTLEVRKSLEVY